jgi:hypothetical protein
VNLASSGICSEKSAKSGKDNWGDLLDEDDSKEYEKGLDEDDGVTTDEDEDENKAWAEAAKARKRRSDSIVDVSSASEPKEGDKGPGSASKSEDHLSGLLLSENNAQSSSLESIEVPQAPHSLEEIEKERHANSIARGRAVHERFLAAREIAKGSEAASRTNEDSLGAYQRTFNNVFGEVPLSEGALKALDKRPEDVARVPSPLLAHVRDKFKKAKPTAVPRIPLDQRLVDPSSLERDKSPVSAPSPARTGNPDDPNEDAEMQTGGNQNSAPAS